MKLRALHYSRAFKPSLLSGPTLPYIFPGLKACHAFAVSVLISLTFVQTLAAGKIGPLLSELC